MSSWKLSLVALVAVNLLLAGCMSWSPRWDGLGAPETPASAGVAAALQEAARRSALVDDARTLQAAIDAYESVLALDPHRAQALTAVADYSILMATAYTQSRREKRRLYRLAQTYSERAMYTNRAFRELVDGGQTPWEAAHVLGPDEMGCMLSWMTALLYNFKECMSIPARVFNIRWIARIDPFLTRMEQLDPLYGEGVVPFNRGFYYFILPRSLGGDKEKAALEFARAVELGPDRLTYRWGRARFFHTRMKNRPGFVEDLEWVVARDPETTADPRHWARYIHRDARRLLEQD